MNLFILDLNIVMKNKKYKHIIFKFIFTLVFFLSITSFTNYYVDPNNLYNNDNFSNKNLIEISQKIQNMDKRTGLLLSGIDERDVKLALSTGTRKYDCAVFGSSLSVQLGQIIDKDIFPKCSSVINLSVSLNTLEDFFALSYMILRNKNKPRKVYLTIYDWSQVINADLSYMKYKDIYEAMLKALDKSKEIQENQIVYLLKLTKNLFSVEYFIYSIDSLLHRYQTRKENQIETSINKNHTHSLTFVKNIDLKKGAKSNLILKDGTMLYSTKYINKKEYSINQLNILKQKKLQEHIDKNRKELRIIDFSKKELDIVYSKKGEKLMIAIIEYYKKHGVELEFILTPRHITTFENNEKMRILILLEKVTKRLAKKTGTNLLGSLYPHKIGCGIMEFYDNYHARPNCLKKIFKMS